MRSIYIIHMCLTSYVSKDGPLNKDFFCIFWCVTIFLSKSLNPFGTLADNRHRVILYVIATWCQ